MRKARAEVATWGFEATTWTAVILVWALEGEVSRLEDAVCTFVVVVWTFEVGTTKVEVGTTKLQVVATKVEVGTTKLQVCTTKVEVEEWAFVHRKERCVTEIPRLVSLMSKAVVQQGQFCSSTPRFDAEAPNLNDTNERHNVMATNSNNTPSKLQTEMQTLSNGLANSTSTLFSSLAVLGSSLAKADIIAKLQSWITLYAAVLQAKQSYAAAVAARTAIELTARAFVAALVTELKQVVGPNNPTLLSSLGIAPAKARKTPSPSTKLVAQAKALQTRKARGTMGKKARQAISANPTQVQVIGVAPVAPAAAPAAPVAAPAAVPTAPAATPAAAAPTPGASSGS